MRHLKSLPIIFLISIMAGLLSPSPTQGQTATIPLLPGSPDHPPKITLSATKPNACTIHFTLPSLLQETKTQAGTTYQSLTIQGGGLTGETGQPGLPSYGGMLELPSGTLPEYTLLVLESKTLTGMNLFPIQLSDSEEFTLDKVCYATKVNDRAPEIILGEPALLFGRRVIPFVIKPVAFDPTTKTVTIAASLEIEFSFTGRSDKNNPVHAPADLPASFTNFFNENVANATLSPADKSSAACELGTYLVICPDNSLVEDALQPLLDWRRRQGYNVLLANLSQAGTTNTAIRNYIETIYQTVTPVLEFVVLVGDVNGEVSMPTWYEVNSGYGGEGDHYYSLLSGRDSLSDVFIGRLSCRSVTQLSTIVAKIVSYETNPPMNDDPGWFSRATLVGDPSSSGNTTILCNQWLKAQIQDIGFAHVDTIWSGNFPSEMVQKINQGVSIFGYRGYYGVSGFVEGHVQALTNGGELPFAVFPTCDSGSWAALIEARNEAFLRNPNGGAIGAIGMATSGTHTRYNNCFYYGVWEAAVNGNDHRLGVAQVGGKLELYRQYGAFESAEVDIWSVWGSLIGDPATDLWLATPGILSVDHPLEIPTGANAVPVSVTSGGMPVAGALVALYKDGEISVTARSDANGDVLLPLDSHTPGSLLVTVWGHNLLPYLGSISLGTVDSFVSLQQSLVDGDGVANPGETLALTCALQNLGTNLAGAVSATLSCDDPLVVITEATDLFGDIDAGSTAWGNFLVELSPLASSGHVVQLKMDIASGADHWASLLSLPVVCSSLNQTAFQWSEGSQLNPGDSGTLSLTLANTGDLVASAASAVLQTNSPWITITQPNSSFADIPVGDVGSNAGSPFSLQIDPSCFMGHLASFTLDITCADRSRQLVEFHLNVGNAASTDPIGPDGYGYFAYDNVDTGHVLAPEYEWVEIDPNYDGPGTIVDLRDFYYEADDTETMTLPFTFKYYGQDYNQVSICSNGWLAMGVNTLTLWRNWSIPSAGSPNGMIAPFWDDLRQSGTNRVYCWYDEPGHRFIVQWSRMMNNADGLQNFQAILLDPTFHHTVTGDGSILFQYETVTNNDITRGYSTTGIQNGADNDGLLYSYYNQYAQGAAGLRSGRAILFTTNGPAGLGTCDVSPPHISIQMQPNQQHSETIQISNTGLSSNYLYFAVEKVDPNPPVKFSGSHDKEIIGSSASLVPGVFAVNQTLDLALSVACQSNDFDMVRSVQLTFPPGVVVNSATPLSFNGQTLLPFLGFPGDGAYLFWNSSAGEEFIPAGTTATATINASFNYAAEDVVLPYTLYCQWGNPVNGEILLEQDVLLGLASPTGGEVWAVGEQHEILFEGSGTVTIPYVRLELQREPDGPWSTLAEAVSFYPGSYNWTVTEPLSAHCRIRVSDASNPELFATSEEFTISRDLTWATIGPYSGLVPGGSQETIALNISTMGLEEGTYAVDLVIRNSVGDPVVVPVTVVVSEESSAVPDVDATFALGQNFPNPFNPSTTIKFSVKQAGLVQVAIFDVMGRLVKTLFEGELDSGQHTVLWDGSDNSGRRVASGTFFYRLKSEDGTLNRKMILMK